MARILRSAETAKKHLSDHPYARIEEEYLTEHNGKPVNLDLELSRLDYEEMITPFIEETLGAIHIALESLFLAGLPGPAAELGLAEVLTMAQLKLAAALPEGARASANRVASRFHLDPVGWFRGAGDARWLPAIARAVGSETAVAVQYRRPDGVVSRKLRPLGLVLKGGIWYFVALSDEQTRTYRVSNLVEVAATEERFARPMGFDLVKFWTVTSQAFEASLYRATATVRVSPRGVEKLTLFGAAVAQAVVESAGAPDADEWVTVTIPIESIDQAATDLLRLGLDAEALEPADLRRRIQSLVEDVRSLYACSAAPDTERVFGR
jgi:predicted DNA-binding transcriptional regulator YafY